MLVYLSKMSRKKKKPRKSLVRAIQTFRRKGGILRTKDALRAGIHQQTLYQLRDEGRIEALSRGLYRLTNSVPLGNPDLLTVALRVPDGVVCLISALSFHELTTQIPHRIYLAIPRGTEPPRVDYPPIATFWFSRRAFTQGVETHTIDRVPVRIYSREKTIADCFKYRNKIGLDTALEALRLYREQHGASSEALLRYAQICRVTSVMRPYLEAIL